MAASAVGVAEDLSVQEQRPAGLEELLSRRKILALVPYVARLDAQHGGGRVVAELLDAVASRHDVALIYLRGSDEPALDPRVAEKCAYVEEVARPDPSPSDARARRALALARRVPAWVLDWRAPQYAAAVERAYRDWRPELVHLHYHLTAQYAQALPGRAAPRILIDHEVGSRSTASVASRARGARRLALRAEVAAWRRYERRAIAVVDAVVVFTDADRDALRAVRPTARVEVIPFGLGSSTPLDAVGDGRTVVFVGNYSHRPNVDAAERLATRIHPLVTAELPDARLLLVGRAPPPNLRALASDSVTITGAVASVEPYVDRAAVFAAPLRLGGGMRVKVAEALAWGKAVVATPLALEGLDVTPGEHALVGESDEEVAAAIVSLLNDEDRRRAVAERARAWATAHLAWQQRVDALDRLHADLLTAR